MMAEREDVGAALTGMLAEMAKTRAAANVMIPEPQEMNVPGNLAIESRGVGAPRVSGGMSVPALGGEIGVEGAYHKPDALAPADVLALLNYRRKF
jgi:hypothetical protein